ncbi:MAG: glycine zipper 2TM domain-containing protein [Candidatus Brocadiia bacterium]
MSKKLSQIVSCLLLCTLLAAAGCASGESFVKEGYDYSKIDKLAVVEIGGDIAGEASKNQVADYLSQEMFKKGYDVIERKQVHAILEEQNFQRSDLTTSQGAAAAGRILNVPAVVIANLSVNGERLSMTAKMIETETAMVLWIGSGYGATRRTLATIGGAVAGGAAGATVGKGRGRVIGGAAGAAVGGAAGEAISPQVVKQIQKVTKKICAGMPRR